jgi:hypothetical protein
MNERMHLGVFGYVHGVSCGHPCVNLVSLPPFIAQIEKAHCSLKTNEHNHGVHPPLLGVVADLSVKDLDLFAVGRQV